MHMYAEASSVDELETITKRMRELMPDDTYCLIYPRMPVLYWLVESALPAFPKVDLETSYSKEWVEHNYEVMKLKKTFPKFIFKEKGAGDISIFERINGLIEDHYALVEELERFKVYKLNDLEGTIE